MKQEKKGIENNMRVLNKEYIKTLTSIQRTIVKEQDYLEDILQKVSEQIFESEEHERIAAEENKLFYKMHSIREELQNGNEKDNNFKKNTKWQKSYNAYLKATKALSDYQDTNWNYNYGDQIQDKIFANLRLLSKYLAKEEQSKAFKGNY